MFLMLSMLVTMDMFLIHSESCVLQFSPSAQPPFSPSKPPPRARQLLALPEAQAVDADQRVSPAAVPGKQSGCAAHLEAQIGPTALF